ncbi:hypothetical protein EMIHUDRAFT_121208 [Emiliania huxleyi CCMP1516]|uniref:Uncharacterized protein n=2 Tax=Emiliania huxleyi TaxID=2903 RepID=A0A0D3I609_EMIH1|nr:hypothetical protein EMIHUDRAFT_121208 [Emiliania huxleyi CCMP1516]EOD06694.1 hypothetical protein EMIHUDRAFT_121208 [Emiliania huxleyi CCMP1516]|eukprot:XP_005759123.1 hypothetical protein EMIHUDRAFT_121208 [Emiliania huxleyi CCMP1516]
MTAGLPLTAAGLRLYHRLMHALRSTEARIHRDVQHEYELRLRNQSRRAGEKASFLQKRAEHRVAALNAWQSDHAAALESALRERDEQARRANNAIAELQEGQRAQMLLREENARLANAAKASRGVTAKLEAALKAQEQTIASLRTQIRAEV